ncbi:hypothetical protein KFK09_023607 [Dendrobium nobile]|uniref:Transmembrane protein n=1 Tax=Dendrobium nobile TaxID=94219 RepID=A0A8T3ABH6_DENNO|nr:hypothetical protein KFK09_023607 [Dendrobium nobile]
MRDWMRGGFDDCLVYNSLCDATILEFLDLSNDFKFVDAEGLSICCSRTWGVLGEWMLGCLHNLLLYLLELGYWFMGFLNTLGSWLSSWYLLKLIFMVLFGLLISPSSCFYCSFCVNSRLYGDRFLGSFGYLCQADGVRLSRVLCH